MKKVIITGGNSGIGYQAAKQLAEKGWSVTLFCRRKEAAEQACEKIWVRVMFLLILRLHNVLIV
ncbi:dehydrogenase-like protein [Streptococcus sanguinis]|jgi:dehydrogenase, eukaryotic-like, putative|uniref:Dehydrogenase-like protein n=1 Tax=Streptococcus sanguinis TaxID=1305 RepID=A0AAJ5NMV2_STRSA|nr:protochlorophyllide oxidoreductase [Streptococcus sanguinis]VDY69845.1 dehydrogenase-like protein [Streptococcus sanguinis]